MTDQTLPSLDAIQARADAAPLLPAAQIIGCDMPVLVAALRAVLALHKPKHGWEQVCEECVRVGLGSGLYAVYPCPTVRAVTAHIDTTPKEKP